jgi:hypothetical protein
LDERVFIFLFFCFWCEFEVFDMSLSKFYRDSAKRMLGIYYSEDMSIRSPVFMNIPEPAPDVLVRPLSVYGIYLGVTDLGRVPFYWDPSLVQNPLIGVIGMPGAGKSELVKSLIIRFKEKGVDVPVIVVDPEGEYEILVKQLNKGVVLNIGTEHYINIFDRPSWDYSYQLWIKKATIPGILKALNITPQLAPIMMRILEQSIKDVYEKLYGFDPVDKETWKRDDPTLLDVVRYIEEDVRPFLEGRQEKQPILFRPKLMLIERMKRWVEGEGTDFFARKSTIKLTDLLHQPLVIFNVKLMPEEARNLFTFFIFTYFYTLMEMSPPLPSFALRIMLVFDEGWILLKREKGERESTLSPLFRRARKYGFSTIIATQQYKDISEDILPLVGTVVLLRIRDAEAVKRLKETLKLPDRITEAIPSLPTGKAVVSIAWKKTDFQNSSIPFMINVETAVEPTHTLIFYKQSGPEETFKTLRQIK